MHFFRAKSLRAFFARAAACRSSSGRPIRCCWMKQRGQDGELAPDKNLHLLKNMCYFLLFYSFLLFKGLYHYLILLLRELKQWRRRLWAVGKDLRTICQLSELLAIFPLFTSPCMFVAREKESCGSSFVCRCHWNVTSNLCFNGLLLLTCFNTACGASCLATIPKVEMEGNLALSKQLQ